MFRPTTSSNFEHLAAHDEQLLRLGMLAERYFPDDPNTSTLKLRQLTELVAQLVAARVGHYSSREEAQYDLLRRLQDRGILRREVAQLLAKYGARAMPRATTWLATIEPRSRL
jgi:type I restriction enzyme, R subunit